MRIPAEVDVEARPTARTGAWVTVFLDEYQLANPQTDPRKIWRPAFSSVSRPAARERGPFLHEGFAGERRSPSPMDCWNGSAHRSRREQLAKAASKSSKTLSDDDESGLTPLTAPGRRGVGSARTGVASGRPALLDDAVNAPRALH
ncbi:hypothetical protein ACSFBC_06315 [Variovorax sp. LT1R16]